VVRGLVGLPFAATTAGRSFARQHELPVVEVALDFIYAV
jgi:hypothetical protein